MRDTPIPQNWVETFEEIPPIEEGLTHNSLTHNPLTICVFLETFPLEKGLLKEVRTLQSSWDFGLSEMSGIMQISSV